MHVLVRSFFHFGPFSIEHGDSRNATTIQAYTIGVFFWEEKAKKKEVRAHLALGRNATLSHTEDRRFYAPLFFGFLLPKEHTDSIATYLEIQN